MPPCPSPKSPFPTQRLQCPSHPETERCGRRKQPSRAGHCRRQCIVAHSTTLLQSWSSSVRRSPSDWKYRTEPPALQQRLLFPPALRDNFMASGCGTNKRCQLPARWMAPCCSDQMNIRAVRHPPHRQKFTCPVGAGIAGIRYRRRQRPQRFQRKPSVTALPAAGRRVEGDRCPNVCAAAAYRTPPQMTDISATTESKTGSRRRALVQSSLRMPQNLPCEVRGGYGWISRCFSSGTGRVRSCITCRDLTPMKGRCSSSKWLRSSLSIAFMRASFNNASVVWIRGVYLQNFDQ